MKSKARLIAYYLPQFHPIPENDKYWGKGFTEWTNVGKAKPLFKGHYQPYLPTELGYYDLRVAEVREAQANLAREYGIEGFCYWHYWFGNGKRLLERPFNEVLQSGEPNFPFCLCWANHTWSTIWLGDTRTIILEQKYPGLEDYTQHFYEVLPAFKDKRYMTVNGNPIFTLFAPRDIPDCKAFTDLWRSLAIKEGLPGLHFIGIAATENELERLGLDACTPISPHGLMYRFPIRWKDKITYRLFKMGYMEWKAKTFRVPKIHSYSDLVDATVNHQYTAHEYPIALPNWDNSPRSKERAYVFEGSTPALFGKMLNGCINAVQNRPKEERLVFIKAWNEWAEGNFLEPEARYGRGYLEAVMKANIVKAG